MKTKFQKLTLDRETILRLFESSNGHLIQEPIFGAGKVEYVGSLGFSGCDDNCPAWTLVNPCQPTYYRCG